MEANQVFVSAVGTFYYVSFGMLYAVLIASGYLVFRKFGALAALVVTLLALPALVLPPWMLLTTDYTVTDTQLLIRSAHVARAIPLAEIVSVIPTRSNRSSPALSLDRLEIRYGTDGSILVSPRDRDGFLAALDR
jgi:hypothetical protein